MSPPRPGNHKAKHSITTTVTPVMEADSQGSEEDDLNTTQSLTMSITNYPMEYGRRYHRYREGSYCYPNDEKEIDRMDMMHALMKMVHGDKIFEAPLRNPKRILDIGTGSGIWCIEAASYFPNAQITGTDLSPIQPTQVPPKVHFVVDDATEPDWLWPLGHFDFIHTAMLLGALPSFPNLIRTAFKYLKPGTGILECHDILPQLFCDDASMPPENFNGPNSYPFHDWQRYLEESTMSLDPPRPVRIADKLAHWMREAGYVDIHERVDKVPINPWPKDPHLKKIGTWSEANWLEGLAAWSYGPFGRGLGWTKDEIEVFLVGVRKCIQNRHVHSYQKVYVVWGRRPGGMR